MMVRPLTRSCSHQTTAKRAGTEQKLIDVALEMIQTNMLAGLNLCQRRWRKPGQYLPLLRLEAGLAGAAINRQFDTIFDTFRRNRKPARFVRRRVANFLRHGSIKTNDSQLRALLVMDGDKDVDPIPMYERGLSQLRQDVINGEVHRGHDLEALQVALSAFTRGYRIFRLPYAKRVGTTPKELDQRVSRILRTWLTAMAEPPPSVQD